MQHGQSLKPYFDDSVPADWSDRAWVFTEQHGQTATEDGMAIRDGQYKLIDYDSPDRASELFDLSIDPWEDADIYTSEPDIAAELEAIIEDLLN